MAYAFGAPSIVQDGLVFYVDAANKDSYVSGSSDTFNILNKSISGSFSSTGMFENINAGVFAFDGAGDTITTTSGLDFFNGADRFTVACWIKLADDGSQNKDIISKGNTSSNNTQFFIRKGKNSNGDKIFLFLDNAGSKYIGGASALSNDRWYYIAGVYKGFESSNNDKGEVYVDGVNDSNSFASSLPSSLVTTTQPLRIGEWQTAATDFDGNISCIQIYNKALSAAEVLQNYNALKGRFT